MVPWGRRCIDGSKVHTEAVLFLLAGTLQHPGGRIAAWSHPLHSWNPGKVRQEQICMLAEGPVEQQPPAPPQQQEAVEHLHHQQAVSALLLACELRTCCVGKIPGAMIP